MLKVALLLLIPAIVFAGLPDKWEFKDSKGRKVSGELLYETPNAKAFYWGWLDPDHEAQMASEAFEDRGYPEFAERRDRFASIAQEGFVLLRLAVFCDKSMHIATVDIEFDSGYAMNCRVASSKAARPYQRGRLYVTPRLKEPLDVIVFVSRVFYTRHIVGVVLKGGEK